MKKQFLLALFSLCMACPIFAQEIDKLARMNGAWLQSKDKDSVEESWLGPRNKVMVGVNLTVSARRGMSHEFLRIVESADGLIPFLFHWCINNSLVGWVERSDTHLCTYR